MGDSKKTVDVIVHKAISLAKGETLSQYSSALTEALRGQYVASLRLTKGKDALYVMEITNGAVIFEVYKEGSNPPFRFYASKYAREDTGRFEFSELTEVERVTLYKPKQSTMVQKAESTPDTAIPASQVAATGKAAEPADQLFENLPDAAFALIEKGAGARHFPHHSSGVKSPIENNTISVPLLRNALARVSKSKSPSNAELSATAHLQRHAKAVLATQGGNPALITKSEDILKALDSIIATATVAKSADGSLYVATGDDFRKLFA